MPARIITPSPEQEASLLWAIELALDDQEHYIKIGDPALDYADEWPEVAATKAEQLNNLAGICDQIGAHQMAMDARKLAAEFSSAGQEAAQ